MTDYRTESDLFSHCLHYKVLDNIVDYHKTHPQFRSSYQIIAYCFRLISTEHINILDILMDMNVLSSMTFEEMREKKITAKDLLSWSAPIDLIEKYQSYFESSEEHLKSERYYNCSKPWFGRYCQYRFDSDEPFTEIVTQTFVGKEFDVNISNIGLTCYVLIGCNRGPPPSCLDWREICDGIVDCLNGSDDMNCLELEINECKENEYRCHQGMCIPEQFINDGPYNPDCLDGSDENDYQKNFRDMTEIFWPNPYSLATEYPNCFQDPSYRCEDTHHRLKLVFRSSVCGDGQPGIQFLPHKIYKGGIDFGDQYKCRNKRLEILEQSLMDYDHNSHLSYECWYIMMCFTYILSQDESDYGCNTFIIDEYNPVSFSERCNHSDYVIFPSYPIFDGHVRFGYWMNESAFDNFKGLIRGPDFICFDSERCPFLPVDIVLDNLTCADNKIFDLNDNDISTIFQGCTYIYKTGNETDCVDSSLFHCPLAHGESKTYCLSSHLCTISDISYTV